MDAQDYLDTPERIDNRVRVALPAQAMAAYRTLERECLLALTEDEFISASSAAVLAGKLLQYANGALYREDKSWACVHEAKLDTLAELIETASGQPLLVAYHFQSDLARLQVKFPQAQVLGQDPQTVATWNRGEIPLLLAHPQSAAHGLNLQHGGHRLVWFSLTWSLERYQQFNARLHRQGQTQPVVIHHLIAQDTVDEDVMAALARKDTTQAQLLDALRARAQELQPC